MKQINKWTHTRLYSFSLCTPTSFILLGPASKKVERYTLQDFKSAFDIPSWTFCALIIDCVILLFKNEWMSLLFRGLFPFHHLYLSSRPDTAKVTQDVIKGKLSKRHKPAFFISFKVFLCYVWEVVQCICSTTMDVGGDQRAAMVNDSKQFSPFTAHM